MGHGEIKLAAGNQWSEVRRQRTEDRGQRTDDKEQNFGLRIWEVRCEMRKDKYRSPFGGLNDFEDQAEIATKSHSHRRFLAIRLIFQII